MRKQLTRGDVRRRQRRVHFATNLEHHLGLRRENEETRRISKETRRK